jgi:hypothetical protein
MRVIERLAEQRHNTTLRTTLRMVQGMEADETTVCCEEEVGVRTSQPRKRIEHSTIQSDEDGRRGTRLQEEFYPMHSMVIGHDSLNYPAPLHQFIPLYLGNGYRSIAVGVSTNSRTM